MQTFHSLHIHKYKQETGHTPSAVSCPRVTTKHQTNIFNSTNYVCFENILSSCECYAKFQIVLYSGKLLLFLQFHHLYYKSEYIIKQLKKLSTEN